MRARVPRLRRDQQGCAARGVWRRRRAVALVFGVCSGVLGCEDGCDAAAPDAEAVAGVEEERVWGGAEEVAGCVG
jgi:hypothetical protein